MALSICIMKYTKVISAENTIAADKDPQLPVNVT